MLCLAPPSVALAARASAGGFCYGSGMKVTRYFEALRHRPDRAIILDEWIERAIRSPIREAAQADGRIRRWAQIPEMAAI
jgi:hypothetical protein